MTERATEWRTLGVSLRNHIDNQTLCQMSGIKASSWVQEEPKSVWWDIPLALLTAERHGKFLRGRKQPPPNLQGDSGHKWRVTIGDERLKTGRLYTVIGVWLHFSNIENSTLKAKWIIFCVRKLRLKWDFADSSELLSWLLKASIICQGRHLPFSLLIQTTISTKRSEEMNSYSIFMNNLWIIAFPSSL